MSTYEMLKREVGDKLDDDVIRKCAMVLDSVPAIKPRVRPREKLAYCRLEDIVRFQEVNT